MPGLVRRDPALTVLKLCSTEAVYSSRLCKHATNQGASGSWLRDWFLEDYGRASERDRTSDLLITNQPAYHFNLLIIIHLDRLRNWLCSDCAHARRCPDWVISFPSAWPAATSPPPLRRCPDRRPWEARGICFIGRQPCPSSPSSHKAWPT